MIRRAFPSLLVLGLLAAAAACQKRGPEEKILPPATLEPRGREINVELKEFSIGMPITLPPVETTFRIVNKGETEHNFEIEGQGMEKSLSAPLQPGESGVLTVGLKPGTYKVYCPVGDHEGKGMTMQLTVAAP